MNSFCPTQSTPSLRCGPGAKEYAIAVGSLGRRSLWLQARPAWFSGRKKKTCGATFKSQAFALWKQMQCESQVSTQVDRTIQKRFLRSIPSGFAVVSQSLFITILPLPFGFEVDGHLCSSDVVAVNMWIQRLQIPKGQVPKVQSDFRRWLPWSDQLWHQLWWRSVADLIQGCCRWQRLRNHQFQSPKRTTSTYLPTSMA